MIETTEDAAGDEEFRKVVMAADPDFFERRPTAGNGHCFFDSVGAATGKSVEELRGLLSTRATRGRFLRYRTLYTEGKAELARARANGAAAINRSMEASNMQGLDSDFLLDDDDEGVVIFGARQQPTGASSSSSPRLRASLLGDEEDDLLADSEEDDPRRGGRPNARKRPTQRGLSAEPAAKRPKNDPATTVKAGGGRGEGGEYHGDGGAG